MDFEERNASIPQELKALDQWMTWDYNEFGTKIPNGKSNDSFTWGSFASVSKFERIAFVFTESDPFTGIDVDDCLRDGEYTVFGVEILDRFRGCAYAEISPSGTGIKLITRAVKPDSARCKNGNLECYDRLRFWTITGDVVGGFEAIGDGQKQLDDLCSKYLAKVDANRFTIPAPFFTGSSVLNRSIEYMRNIPQAGEGERNHKAFSHAGHLRSFVGDFNERLSEEQILSLVREWNSKNYAPLPDDEIVRCVQSSAKNGKPRADKPAEELHKECSLENIEEIIDKLFPEMQTERDEADDEDFCRSMIPDDGMIRNVYEFYMRSAYRCSHVMGLAVSISLCETIMGRRVRSQTDMRTNDYNLILAPTGSGKEACESAITKILNAADATGSHLLPPDIQSGNGLMHAISKQPCGIWVCDEFGKILQAVLDKKGNQHIKNIGNHLLKLYGKSSGVYGGAAHSDGVRNKVTQPHLVLLGLSTGSTVFGSVSTDQVSDGLIGRIAIWPVQERPEAKDEMGIAEPDELLVGSVANWLRFKPGGNLADINPIPSVVKMTPEAWDRWKTHSRAISHKMGEESESRAAVWARVAARSMKLALVHRCARIKSDPSTVEWEFVNIDLEDINWGIRLGNWLAKIACDLVKQNTVDASVVRAKAILSVAVEKGSVNVRDLCRACRSLTAGDFEAAARELGLKIRTEKGGRGRPRKFYEKANTDDPEEVQAS